MGSAVYVMPRYRYHGYRVRPLDILLCFAVGAYVVPVIAVVGGIWVFTRLRTIASRGISYVGWLICFIFVIYFVQFVGAANLLRMTYPVAKLCLYAGLMVFVTLIYGATNDRGRCHLFIAFVTGVATQVTYVIFFNKFIIQSANVYGGLYNPFTSQVVNSPGWSLMLVVTVAPLIVFVLTRQRYYIHLLCGVYALSTLYLAYYLAGRAFFVVFILIVIWATVSLRTKLTRKIAWLCGVGAIGYGAVLWWSGGLGENDYLIRRFADGLQSRRFALWKQGLNDLVEHPLGGFTVDQSIDTVSYFHNVVLDSARVTGWLGAGLFLVTLALGFVGIAVRWRNRDTAIMAYGVTFLTCAVVMMQDVIVEGLWRIFVLYYVAIFCLWMRESRSRCEGVGGQKLCRKGGDVSGTVRGGGSSSTADGYVREV